MDDLPRRLAALLESLATRVRSLTVDRVDRVARIVALVLPAAVLGGFAVVFLFMTIHGALAIPLGDAGAFAVVGGLFGVGGLFLWQKRTSNEP